MLWVISWAGSLRSSTKSTNKTNVDRLVACRHRSFRVFFQVLPKRMVRGRSTTCWATMSGAGCSCKSVTFVMYQLKKTVYIGVYRYQAMASNLVAMASWIKHCNSIVRYSEYANEMIYMLLFFVLLFFLSLSLSILYMCYRVCIYGDLVKEWRRGRRTDGCAVALSDHRFDPLKTLVVRMLHARSP